MENETECSQKILQIIAERKERRNFLNLKIKTIISQLKRDVDWLECFNNDYKIDESIDKDMLLNCTDEVLNLLQIINHMEKVILEKVTKDYEKLFLQIYRLNDINGIEKACQSLVQSYCLNDIVKKDQGK